MPALDNFKGNSSHRPKSLATFNISNIITDPFASATLSICIVSWIIAFAGSVASDISETFPRFTWWGIVFQLLMMVALILFYGYDLIDQYRLFLVSGFSIAFVYTTNSATSLVYAEGSRKAAASAGVILLSMINLIWVFYFGGDNLSPVNAWIDSFSLKGIRSSNNPFHQQNQIHQDPAYRYSQQPHNDGAPINTNGVYNNRNSISSQKYVSSSRLNGLENFSENDFSADTRQDFETPVRYEQSVAAQPSTLNTVNTALTHIGDTIDTNFVIENFPYTARALYDYESNPDDENELSFQKGEILKVGDIQSKWWQAKRSNGEVGLCPSNYVELIE